MKDKKDIKLTQCVQGAGWASKLGPGDLENALKGLTIRPDSHVIVGLEKPDDAGVYLLTEEIALIQTVDYFTPIVDDPYNFGRIAAVNALSDVYAMGGKPLTALNLVFFPIKTMDISILKEILRGGLDILEQAEVALLGGHSVDDPELKYGLSVTGTVHPAKLIANSHALPGDRLILTKPLGTGIVNTAIKAGMADAKTIAEVTASMTALNRKAQELMQKVGVHACTDATGFGLLGHLMEMLRNSGVSAHIHSTAVPIFQGAPALAAQGLVPGGTFRNRNFLSGAVSFSQSAEEWASDILFDPQTSGGLLIAVEEKKARLLLEELHTHGVSQAAIIGEIVSGKECQIFVH